VPQTEIVSGSEDDFRSSVLSATLLWFGLFDLFLVLYTYASRRDWLGSFPYMVQLLFVCYIVLARGRVLAYYLVGLWLATGAFALNLFFLVLTGGLGFLGGFAQVVAGFIGAGAISMLSPRVGPFMARRRAQGKLA
jgi:hypothetical protein